LLRRAVPGFADVFAEMIEVDAGLRRCGDRGLVAVFAEDDLPLTLPELGEAVG
jgi:hypothetical protein